MSIEDESPPKKDSLIEKYKDLQYRIGLTPWNELSQKQKITSGIIFGVVLFFELFCYNGFKQMGSGFFGENLSYNPLSIIFRCIRDDFLVFLIFLIIAYALMKLLPMLLAKDKGNDPRGFKRATGSEATQGESRLLDMETKKKMFKLADKDEGGGLILGVDKDSQKLLISPWQHDKKNLNYAPTNRNIVVVGPSGKRKTSGVLLGFMFEMIRAGHSFVVTDPKGEIYRETLAAALAHGYKIKVLNLIAGELEYSDGWDIMKFIRTAYNPHTAAKLVAMILLGPIKDEKEFWAAGNINLLCLVLIYVAKAESFASKIGANTKNETRTFAAVIDLLNSDDLKDTLERSLNASTKDKALLRNYYNTWSTNKEAKQIQAGLCTALSLFNDVALTTLLSEDDIDFKELNDEKTILYAICSDKDSVYKNVTTLFTTFLFNEMTNIADKKPLGKLDRPFWAIFEEFNNVGYVADLSVKVSTLRSRNIGIILCYQNLTQAMDTYGSIGPNGKYEWETIYGNCALKLCLGSDDQETSKYFSEKSGYMTIYDETIAQEVSTFAPSALQFNTRQRKTVAKKQVPVLQTDAIEKLPVDQIIIYQAGQNCTVEQKYFYQHHPMYNLKILDDESGEIIVPHRLDHIPEWKKVLDRIDKERLSGIKSKESRFSIEEIYRDMVVDISDFKVEENEEGEVTAEPVDSFLSKVKNFCFEEVPDEEDYKPTYSQATFESLLQETRTIPKDAPPFVVSQPAEKGEEIPSQNSEGDLPPSLEDEELKPVFLDEAEDENPFGDNPYF